MTNKELQVLWGDILYKAFKNNINEDGWLTNDWSEILEYNFSDWDDHYNDTNTKSRLYQQMYLTDFDDNFDNTMIKPSR